MYFIDVIKFSHVFQINIQGHNTKLNLTPADENDFIQIIEKVLPAAPKFKIILESQLRNAKQRDPRHRRWSAEMISLCLNLWAKYVLQFPLYFTILQLADLLMYDFHLLLT